MSDTDTRLEKLESTIRNYRRAFLVLAGFMLAAVTAAFAPMLLQDPEAFKITTPNGSSSPTTRIQVSGNENTAQIGVLNSNMGLGTSSQFGSGVGVYGLANATTNPSTNPTGGGVLYSDGGQLKWRRSDGSVDTMGSVSSGPSLDVALCQGRLTLTSGTPVTTSDVTAATTVYFTPFVGNRIALYSGSSWSTYTFTERSLSLSGLAANTNCDVFIYDNSGTLTLESTSWTNDTTRATALTTQDGIYVKSGATTRRYVGTFRTTGTTGQTEDSGDRGSLTECKRYLWNYYNRVPRRIRIIDTTDSWTYNTNAWRSWDNNAANRISFVCGIAEEPIRLTFYAMHYDNGYNTASVGIGIDSTSTNSADVFPSMNNVATTGTEPVFSICEYNQIPSAGYHFAQLLEIGSGSGSTTTWYGDKGRTWSQSGAIGWVKG